MHTIDPRFAPDEKSKKLFKMIIDYQLSDEDFYFLEKCKEKTVVEIDQKFKKSKMNQTYKFPLKSNKNIQNSSGDDSLRSLEGDFYDLYAQNHKMQEQKQQIMLKEDYTKKKSLMVRGSFPNHQHKQNILKQGQIQISNQNVNQKKYNNNNNSHSLEENSLINKHFQSNKYQSYSSQKDNLLRCSEQLPKDFFVSSNTQMTQCDQQQTEPCSNNNTYNQLSISPKKNNLKQNNYSGQMQKADSFLQQNSMLLLQKQQNQQENNQLEQYSIKHFRKSRLKQAQTQSSSQQKLNLKEMLNKDVKGSINNTVYQVEKQNEKENNDINNTQQQTENKINIRMNPIANSNKFAKNYSSLSPNKVLSSKNNHINLSNANKNDSMLENHQYFLTQKNNEQDKLEIKRILNKIVNKHSSNQNSFMANGKYLPSKLSQSSFNKSIYSETPTDKNENYNFLNNLKEKKIEIAATKSNNVVFRKQRSNIKSCKSFELRSNYNKLSTPSNNSHLQQNSIQLQLNNLTIDNTKDYNYNNKFKVQNLDMTTSQSKRNNHINNNSQQTNLKNQLMKNFLNDKQKANTEMSSNNQQNKNNQNQNYLQYAQNQSLFFNQNINGLIQKIMQKEMQQNKKQINQVLN